MDLRDCLRATRRHPWLVLGVLAVALGIAGLTTALAVPQYATTVTFFVTTPGQGVTDSYQGALFSQQRVKSYVALLTGDRLAAIVAAEESVGLTAPDVQQRISARAMPDTVLLQATVIDSDPNRSLRVATVLATQFVALISTVETPAGSNTPAVKVDVVAGPRLNPEPISPRPLRNLASAALLGLVAGLAGAVARDALDITIKTPEALRDAVGSAALAVIPFDATAKRSPLVMDADAHSPRAEALRHLRTNLQYVDVDRPVRVIVVTSALPGEGKSTTACNLAIAFAEAGRRTLLVEADLRRPRVADYLGLEGAVGLSNVLAGQVALEAVLQRWGRHDLHVLSSGFIPPNPSEMLGSRNMAALLLQLRDDFDVIVIDAPPLLPVTDAAVVAAAAEGAVLVTRSGKTPQARVRAAVARLEAVDARVLGCVLNMHPTKGESEYYSYRRHTAERRRGPRRSSAVGSGSLAGSGSLLNSGPLLSSGPLVGSASVSGPPGGSGPGVGTGLAGAPARGSSPVRGSKAAPRVGSAADGSVGSGSSVEPRSPRVSSR